jgi:hypothetical protein
MTDRPTTALEVIQLQIKDLDDIVKQATVGLNVVAGAEQIAKWKTRTRELLAQHLGKQEATRFSATNPGPSFSNDLLEELNDEAETYRNFLVTLSEHTKKSG